MSDRSPIISSGPTTEAGKEWHADQHDLEYERRNSPNSPCPLVKTIVAIEDEAIKQSQVGTVDAGDLLRRWLDLREWANKAIEYVAELDRELAEEGRALLESSRDS